MVLSGLLSEDGEAQEEKEVRDEKPFCLVSRSQAEKAAISKEMEASMDEMTAHSKVEVQYHSKVVLSMAQNHLWPSETFFRYTKRLQRKVLEALLPCDFLTVLSLLKAFSLLAHSEALPPR